MCKKKCIEVDERYTLDCVLIIYDRVVQELTNVDKTAWNHANPTVESSIKGSWSGGR